MSLALTGISSMATREILAELCEDYARRTGVEVRIQSVGGVDAARRVRDGEAFDVVVLASGALQALEADAHLIAGSRVDVARSAMAIAVPAGAPHPAVDDAAAVKAAVLQARAIGYSTGPSGEHLLKVLGAWGIAEEVSAKLVRAPAGTPVGTLLARGEVDLGFQQLSEFIHAPGVDVLGRMPDDIQAITTFSAAIAATRREGDAARAFLGYLASPSTAEVKRRAGMDPAA